MCVISYRNYTTPANQKLRQKKADPKYLACEWRLMCRGVNQTILHCLTGDSAAESLTEADDSTDLEETEPTVYSTPA